jgi:hypothetical protein
VLGKGHLIGSEQMPRFRLSLSFAELAALALLALAPALRAQNMPAVLRQASSTTGKAQIVGIVIDSLNGSYLAGADIVIDSRKPPLRTDSLGKFRIDSLGPGTYQVGVFHPLLDTLGITLVTQPIRVGPDSSSFVIVAVPSAATLIHRSCVVQAGDTARSAVIGHVADAETLQPLSKVEVSVAWTDIDIAKGSGLRRRSRLVRDTTDAAGSFQICGLPSSLKATLQARRGSVATTEIPIALGDRSVELLARTVLLPSGDLRTNRGDASVSGVVTLAGSATNIGTRVEYVGTDIFAMTNGKGQFTIRNVPSGSGVLVARHLGFDAEAVPVDLMSREEKRVDIHLRQFVPIMEAVQVTGRKTEALEKVGFTQRRKTAAGFYLGPEVIENLHAIFLTDILKDVPGLYLARTLRGEVVISSHRPGSACVQYYLDDTPYMEVTPGDIQKFVSGGEVVAVEVYQDLPPVQYSRGGVSCITIVVWTRFKIRG